MRKWISRSLVWIMLTAFIVLSFMFPESRYIHNASIFLGFLFLFMSALFIIIILSFQLKDGKPIHTGHATVTGAVSLIRSKREQSDFSTGVFLLLIIALSVSGHWFPGIGLLILKFFSAWGSVAAVDYMEAFRPEDIS